MSGEAGLKDPEDANETHDDLEDVVLGMRSSLANAKNTFGRDSEQYRMILDLINATALGAAKKRAHGARAESCSCRTAQDAQPQQRQQSTDADIQIVDRIRELIAKFQL